MDQQSPIKRAQELLSLQSFSSVHEPIARASQSTTSLESVEVNDDLRKRKEEQELEHRDKRFKEEMEKLYTDMDLKKKIYRRVFQFLSVETAAVFLIVILQGLKPWNFHLEDSTINIFLGATLLQISSMAYLITRHLYPTPQA